MLWLCINFFLRFFVSLDGPFKRMRVDGAKAVRNVGMSTKTLPKSILKGDISACFIVLLVHDNHALIDMFFHSYSALVTRGDFRYSFAVYYGSCV